MRIAAVVVTYNRLHLLMECLQALQNQTKSVDEIIVVNNRSTDGTTEWLEQQTSFIVINQDNIGGAGGFYTGAKYAFQKRFDWIWMMDDDVAPTPQCLESLLSNDDSDVGILQPLRIFEGNPVLLESTHLNLTNPFKGLHNPVIKNDINEKCRIEAVPFEGPLIKREVFVRIGFPNKEFFIFYDDTDFSYRTVMSGMKIFLIPKAILWKKLLTVGEKQSWSWKKRYEIRNAAYFDKTYGKNSFVKYMRPFVLSFRYMLHCLIRNNDFSWKIAVDILKYTVYGLKGKLGKI